jgi:sugar phosphate isomerase/epimerase
MLGNLLCIENMDKRKPVGRTVRELELLFQEFPQASFCFDIGHARQVDTSMVEAYLMLKHFRSRLRQVHISEVNTQSKHDRLSFVSIVGFQEVTHLIPSSTPAIIESVVPRIRSALRLAEFNAHCMPRAEQLEA